MTAEKIPLGSEIAWDNLYFLKTRRRNTIPRFTTALSLLLATVASAAKPPAFSLRSLSPTPRSFAPIPLRAGFNREGVTPLTGRLRLEVQSDGHPLVKTLSGDIVLVNGVRRWDATLPSATATHSLAKSSIKATFVTEKESFPVGEFPVNLPPVERRSLVIGVCESESRHHSELSPVAAALRLENFDRHQVEPSFRTLRTSLARFDADDAPVSPADFFAYDVALFDSDSFSSLSKRQLNALKRWIRAGGAVGLFLGDSPVLSPRHLKFLNEAAATLPSMGSFTLSPEGTLAPPDTLPENRTLLANLDLGGVAIVFLQFDPKTDADAFWWRRTAGFLWRLREKRKSALTRTGKWFSPEEYEKRLKGTVDDSATPKNFNRYRRGRSGWTNQDDAFYVKSELFNYRWRPLPIGHSLLTTLMPKTSRALPFSLVLAILGGFVLLVGPLDYFVLGKLNIRRFTWISFPAVSVLTTLLVVHLSDVYMGTQNHRHAFTIIDVGADGDVLRRNAIELRFLAREGDVENSFQNAVFTPLNFKEYSPNSAPRPSAAGVRYEGNFPRHYQTTQRLGQWTPRLNRILDMPEESLSGMNWDAINPFTNKGVRAMKRQLFGDRTIEAEVFLFRNRQAYKVGDKIVPARPFGKEEDARFFNFLRALCFRDVETGLFSVVSRISPTGGASFEDLAVLDADDPDQCLVVAVIRDGRDHTIYRRLFMKGRVGL